MNLTDLKIGEQGVVANIDNKICGIERLKELGVTVGAKIKVKSYSPFNDPIMIEVRGCCLMLRVELARMIEVEIIEENLSNRQS